MSQSGIKGGFGGTTGRVAEGGIARRVAGGCFSEKKRHENRLQSIDQNGGRWHKVGRSGAQWGEFPLEVPDPLKPFFKT
jgi:hypothetical protein